MAQAEWIAYRQNEVADAHDIRIADWHFDQIIALDLNECDIGGFIGPYNFGIENFTVHQRYLDLVGICDDMMIRQYIAARSIDNDARSSAGNFLRTAAIVRQPEESAKGLVTDTGALRDRLADSNIDDRRGCSLHEGRKTRHGFVIN